MFPGIVDLSKLKVNSDDWQPNAFLFVKRRFFQRKDGYVFPVPETEDWHIARLLAQGFVEVEGPEAEPPAIAQRVTLQHAALQAKVAQQHAVEDPRDKQIALLIANQEQLTRLIETLARGKEASGGDSPGDAPDHRQGARTHR